MRSTTISLVTSALLTVAPSFAPTVMAGTADQPPAPLEHAFDPIQLRRGEALFQRHCTQCHGDRAEGAANWRQRLPDGSFPPPPLNGSGHAWHHAETELKEVIIFGRNRMPAWNGKLGRQDVDDVVAWFQSLWPKETYRVWAVANRRAQAR